MAVGRGIRNERQVVDKIPRGGGGWKMPLRSVGHAAKSGVLLELGEFMWSRNWH